MRPSTRTHEVGPSFLRVLVPARAVCESERTNPRVPVVRRASRGIVAPRVPECTVINRIDRHLAVVSEEEVIVLDATAVNEGQLTTRQSAQRIGRLPARVVDRGIYAGARNVESYGDIPVPVHRHTSKPPIIGIGRIGPLADKFPTGSGFALLSSCEARTSGCPRDYATGRRQQRRYG